MKITLVAGARPNFVKIAPIIKAIQEAQNEGFNIQYNLIHTGQHFDYNMSQTFFKDLNIPEPDINLNCGGGTQANQTASIMIAFENFLFSDLPDLVLVVGDVTSTLACSIVAKKLNVKVAHVEAGIRSFDLSMPEEINRIVTDSISDFFFTTSRTANANLKTIGVKESQIFFVGNVMIDTLQENRKNFKKPKIWNEIGLKKGNYLVLTLHRPSNVDNSIQLASLINEIVESSQGLQIIFPVHPRTARIIRSLNIIIPKSLYLIEPLGYLEFNYLVEFAKAVITDSGGITEETTVYGVPCLTIRENTERPETVTIGTNELIGTNPGSIMVALEKVFAGTWKKGNLPELWDGQSSQRIVSSLLGLFENEKDKPN